MSWVSWGRVKLLWVNKRNGGNKQNSRRAKGRKGGIKVDQKHKKMERRGIKGASCMQDSCWSAQSPGKPCL